MHPSPVATFLAGENAMEAMSSNTETILITASQVGR
jgi:hypothetical protein